MKKTLILFSIMLMSLAFVPEVSAQSVGTPINVGRGRVVLPYFSSYGEPFKIEYCYSNQFYGSFSNPHSNVDYNGSYAVISLLPPNYTFKFRVVWKVGSSYVHSPWTQNIVITPW